MSHRNWYPKPYNTYEGRKKAASAFQHYIVSNLDIVLRILQGITEIDKHLYSDDMRTLLTNKLRPFANTATLNALQTMVDTRKSLYRFCVKGSNALPILKFYFDNKYEGALKTPFPDSFLSDFDSTILINPNLSAQEFTTIQDTFIPFLETQFMMIGVNLGDSAHFQSSVRNALHFGKQLISVDDSFRAFRKYDFAYKDEMLPLYRIGEKNVVEEEKSGKGIRVTSDKNPGRLNKFYLCRILANVVASRNIKIPIELMDVSMNYQNEDLRFSWDSYSEYRITVESYGFDFRLLSATSLYSDIVKCVYDAKHSTEQSRKNKVPARIKRLHEILDTMIIPYSTSNDVIKENIQKHSDTKTFLGSVYRKLNLTRKNRSVRRIDPENFYSSSDDDIISHV